jgi:integrase
VNVGVICVQKTAVAQDQINDWVSIAIRLRRIAPKHVVNASAVVLAARDLTVAVIIRFASRVRDHRHLRGPRVICEDDGSALTRQKVQYRMKRAARRANLTHEGVHILRHTFCSHLAMRGAPAKAIQELLGHQDLSMTQRYMHLSPAALDAAIRLLDGPQRGDILETAGSANR